MHKKIKTTITLSGHIKEFASKEAEALGLDFSAYLTVLIAEKMRGSSLLGNNISMPNSPTLPTIEAISPVTEEATIDDSQINELDRLLSFNEIAE